MNPPPGIDLKYSSFNKKAKFTSLKNSNKLGKKNATSRYVPGGDWAEESNNKNGEDLILTNDNNNVFSKTKETPSDNILSLDNEIDFGYIERQKEIEEKQKSETNNVTAPKKEKSSKFGFIKKKNKSETKNEQTSTSVIIPSIKLNEEKYKYPKKIVQEIVEPIGARKKPSETVLQNFIKQTSNFDPKIVLSIIYHLLKDPTIVWLSKYRGLIALETLLKKNKVYLEKAKEFGEMFKNGVYDTCSSESFSQKSHEQLIVKTKTNVVNLLNENNNDNETKKTFDFDKMNQMIQNSSKPKRTNNTNFMEEMSNIKIKSKQNKTNANNDNINNLNNDFDLLDLGVDNSQSQVSNNNQNTNLNDFDFDISSNNNTNINYTNNNNNQTKQNENNLFDLDFGNMANNEVDVNTSNADNNNHTNASSTNNQQSNNNYDDLDFL